VSGRRAAPIVLAFVMAAIVFDVVVLSWGETPRSIAREILGGTWGNAYGTGQVLFKATSILLAAVAARVALRAGLFNIGVDGSIAVAAIAVGAVGATFPPGISAWIAWPALALVAFVVGALWALPVGVLRARFGAHEVISGIMLNNVAAAFIGWLLSPTGGKLAEHASVHTRALPAGARLVRLDQLAFGLRALHGSAANVALVVAIAVAFAWSWLARKTIAGRELAAVGASPTVARASGIRVGRRFVEALLVSGAIAGLCALNDVMGYKGYAEEGVSSGVGFTGLAAALLAGESALGLVAASLLFATLSQGGLSINARVPMEIVDVLVAVLILLVDVSPAIVLAIQARVRSRSAA
jgi:simple sugar transport system permease protein